MFVLGLYYVFIQGSLVKELSIPKVVRLKKILGMVFRCCQYIFRQLLMITILSPLCY